MDKSSIYFNSKYLCDLIENQIIARYSFSNFPVEMLASAEDGGAVADWED